MIIVHNNPICIENHSHFDVSKHGAYRAHTKSLSFLAISRSENHVKSTSYMIIVHKNSISIENQNSFCVFKFEDYGEHTFFAIF